MNKIIHKIELDFSLPCARKHVYSSRLDSGSRTLEFTLTNGGEPYVIDKDATVYLYARLSDETRVFEECSFSGSVVTAPLTSNMTDACATTLQLKITTPDGGVLSTPAVTVHNLSSVVSDDAVMATDEFSALIDAVNKAESTRITSVVLSGGELIITYADGGNVSVSLEPLNGEDGLSPYDYACSMGYEGSEKAFADMLVGVTSAAAEEWVFTLEDGSTVKKRVVVL